MAVLFDVDQQPGEALFPLVSLGIPRPTGHARQPIFELGIEGASVALGPLRGDPDSESIAFNRVRLVNAGMTVFVDKSLQQPEPELPTRRGLFDKPNLEGTREGFTDLDRQVGVNFRREPGASAPSTKLAA